MNEVIVGVDGSERSHGALRLAASEARYRSGRLHIVYVYEPAHSTGTEAASAVVASGTWSSPSTNQAVLRNARRKDEEGRAEAQRHAEAVLRQLVSSADTDLDDLDVERSAIGDEHPAAALVRLSRSADLLVVGSRGRGGFAGLLLGSVSQQCVNHAACPVLVVRS